MVRGMPGPNRDKRSKSVGRSFVLGANRGLDHRLAVARFNDPCFELQGLVTGGRQIKNDLVFRRNGTRRRVSMRSDHQMPGSCPIHVAVQQRADNAAIDHALESLVMRLGFKYGNHPVILHKALDLQSVFIGRSTSETNQMGCKLILQTLGWVHIGSTRFETKSIQVSS